MGLAAIVLPVLRSEKIEAQRAHALARRWLIGAAVLLMAGAAAFFAAQAVPLELGYTTVDEWVSFVQLSLLGQMLMARVALGVLALFAVLLLPTPNARLIVCVVVGLLAQATITRTSHTAAMAEGWLPIASDFAHLLAGALWGGGLVALSVPLSSQEGATVSVTRTLIQRFSPLGMAGVVLAAGTGLVLSAQQVPNADALRTSDYGALLLVKVAVVFVAVQLAGLHKYITQRQIKTTAGVQRFKRTLGIETAIVVGVFVCAALLTSTAPPHKMATHPMEDGTTMTMGVTDKNFERALHVAAVAVVAAGALALALEWRTRPHKNL